MRSASNNARFAYYRGEALSSLLVENGGLDSIVDPRIKRNLCNRQINWPDKIANLPLSLVCTLIIFAILIFRLRIEVNFVDRFREMIGAGGWEGASKREARYERMTTTRQIFDTNTWWKNWFDAIPVKFRSKFTLEWRAQGKIGRVLIFVYSPKNLLEGV